MTVCSRFGPPYPKTGPPWPKTGTPSNTMNVILHIFPYNFLMDWNIQIIFSDSFSIHAA